MTVAQDVDIGLWCVFENVILVVEMFSLMGDDQIAPLAGETSRRLSPASDTRYHNFSPYAALICKIFHLTT